jgi:hypothetical protein
MADELDRREMIEAAMEQAEEGTLEAPIETEIDDDHEAQSSSEEGSTEEGNDTERDEKGRFKSKSEEASSQDDSDQESDMVAENSDDVQVEVDVPRPTTWKKEYVEVWEKMKDGKALDKQDFVKFAEYANQREAEYKRGVSAYKAEADNARSLTEAIGPFVPELQAQNIHPAAWINNLGRAHMVLSKAPYDQKVQMFHRLAQDYGIQLNSDSLQVAEQQPQDYQTQQLMAQLQAMNQEVSTIKGRYEQEEQTRLVGEIERVRSDKARFPHFDMVREDMAQLLERGLAPDLESAYAKAVRLNDEAWKVEQDRLLKSTSQQASKAKQVAKAKATAVSPRSVTPSGAVNKSDAKDRRSIIAEQLGQAMSDRV